MTNYKRRFHIWVEVAKVDSNKYKRREYTVEAETRTAAEREALVVAKGEWASARLPEDRLF